MKKYLIAAASAVLLIVASGCGDESTKTESAEKVEQRIDIPESAIDQTVKDTESSEDVSKVNIEVNDDKIDVRLSAENISSADQAIDFADSLLRTIPTYVDEASSPEKNSYGNLYDGYYVNIVVEDGSGIKLAEGNKYPSTKSFTWE